ncbi:MAG: tyrosine-type recombinase/integrase [Robiginitomaculum sp.]|nr:tyrosine-type recombinase/integrase [Robiginitomaculum sp.]
MTRLYGQPWNKGRNVGPRQALTPVNVRAVKKYLAQQKSPHDLCLFTVAIDSMLRASDLMRLRVSDVSFPNGNIRNSFLWRQKKTSNGVNPVLTDYTQRVLKRWVNASNKLPNHFLFTREKPIDGEPITVGFYRNLVKDWVKAIGLPPHDYSAHSLRRSKAIYMYESGVAVEIIGRLLGHKSPASTLHYLGIDDNSARAIANEYDIFKISSVKKPVQNRQFSAAEISDLCDQIWAQLAPKLSELFDETPKIGR